MQMFLTTEQALELAFKAKENIKIGNTEFKYVSPVTQVFLKGKLILSFNAKTNLLTINFNGNKSKVTVKRLNTLIPLTGHKTLFLWYKNEVFEIVNGEFIKVDLDNEIHKTLI